MATGESKNKTGGTFLDFLDGGQGKNIGLTNDVFDLQQFVLDGDIELQRQAGQISDEDAEKMKAEAKKQNDVDRAAGAGDAQRRQYHGFRGGRRV